jgi:hypothetical protein
MVAKAYPRPWGTVSQQARPRAGFGELADRLLAQAAGAVELRGGAPRLRAQGAGQRQGGLGPLVAGESLLLAERERPGQRLLGVGHALEPVVGDADAVVGVVLIVLGHRPILGEGERLPVQLIVNDSGDRESTPGPRSFV